MSKSTRTTVGSDRQALTVYSSGFGVIQESRLVRLSPGDSEIQLEGMPIQYVPDSILVLGVDCQGQFTLGPISYQPANFTPANLLGLLEGQQLELKFKSNTNRQRSVAGTLLHFLGDKFVFARSEGRTSLIATSDIEEVIFEGELPTELSRKACLVVNAKFTTGGAVAIKFLYRTRGLSWKATHSAVYDEKAGLLRRLESWVTVVNGSGADYRDASLKLLAGDVEPDNGGGYQVQAFAAAAPMGGGMKRAGMRQAGAQSVGEKKLYVVPDLITLLNGESKQVPLFRAADVPVESEYFVPATSAWQGQQNGMQPVSMRLRLKNSRRNKLGSPMPAGSVNIYQADEGGDLQLTASSTIEHVAHGEPFELSLGTSMDVKAQRNLVSSQTSEPAAKAVSTATPVAADSPAADETDAESDTNFRDDTFEVTVHNFKTDGDVEVRIFEELAENAALLESTHEFASHSTTSLSAPVTVKSGKKVTVRYTIRTTIDE